MFMAILHYFVSRSAKTWRLIILGFQILGSDISESVESHSQRVQMEANTLLK